MLRFITYAANILPSPQVSSGTCRDRRVTSFQHLTSFRGLGKLRLSRALPRDEEKPPNTSSPLRDVRAAPLPAQVERVGLTPIHRPPTPPLLHHRREVNGTIVNINHCNPPPQARTDDEDKSRASPPYAQVERMVSQRKYVGTSEDGQGLRGWAARYNLCGQASTR